MIWKIIALVIIVLLLVADYAMLIVAHNADEQAKRMYKLWKEQNENNKNKGSLEKNAERIH